MNCLKTLLALLPVAALLASGMGLGHIAAADNTPPDMTPQQIEAFRNIRAVRLVIREEYQDCLGKTVPLLQDWPRTAIEAMGIKVVENAEAPADATFEVSVRGNYTKAVVNLETRPFEPEALSNRIETRLSCSLMLTAGNAVYTTHLPEAGPRCTSTGEIDPWKQMEGAVPKKELVRSIIQTFSAFRTVDKVKVLIALLRFDKEDYGRVSVGGVACSIDNDGRWHCTPIKEEWQERLGPFVEQIRPVGADAVQPLCEALRSETVAIRRGAARALGAIGNPRAVEPLLVAVKDPEDSVAQTAIAAVGKMRGEEAVASLIRALKAERFRVGYEAAKALGRIGDARAVEPLIEVLTGDDGLVAYAAAGALGNIADARAVAPLIEALRDGGTMIRYSAAESLGKIGDRRAVEPLTAALRDEDSMVRCKAAVSLGQICDRRSVDGLIAALDDKDSSVRYDAVRALVRIGDPRAVPALLAKATNDEDLLMRQSAAEAAVHLDPKAIESIVSFLKSPEPRRRWEAAEWLGRIGDPSALPALKDTAEKDPDEAVRARAKKAIEEVQPPQR